MAEAERLAAKKDAAQLPLYGVPVAVKDNIDVAGLPTTAACPAFSYTPTRDATAVARLRAAGAIMIGKTNLDQFATGLVGVRSPYGIPKNPLRGRSDSGRIEFGLGGCGIGRTGAAGARHRHRGKRPGAGDAQQHRRAEAEPGPGLDRGRGAGVPDAGLRLGVLAHRRRRRDGACGDGRPDGPIRFRATGRSAR